MTATLSGGALALPFSLSGVAERTGSYTSYAGIVGSSADNQGIYFNDAANGLAIYNGGGTLSTLAANDNAFHAIQGVFPTGGADCTLYSDGTSEASQPCGNNTMNATMALGNNGGDGLGNGNIEEGGIYPGGYTSTQAGNVCHNQTTYYGITGTC
jgi:hypothetical protein